MNNNDNKESTVSEQIKGTNGTKRIAPVNRNVGAKHYTYANYKKLKDVPSSSRKPVAITVIIIIAIFAFLIFSSAFALALNGTNTYANGIKVMGVDISRFN